MMEMNMMMKMYFHFRTSEYILVKEWMPNSNPNYILSCVAVALIALAYEGLRYFRAILFKYAKENQPCCPADITRRNGNVARTHRSIPETEVPECDCGPNGVHAKRTFIPMTAKSLLDRYHVFQTLMYFVQMYIAYSLMMIAMTYNTPICLSLLLGHMLGFLILAPLLTYKEQEKVGDCCS